MIFKDELNLYWCYTINFMNIWCKNYQRILNLSFIFIIVSNGLLESFLEILCFNLESWIHLGI